MPRRRRLITPPPATNAIDRRLCPYYARLAERVVANGVDLTGIDTNDAEHSRLIEVTSRPAPPRPALETV